MGKTIAEKILSRASGKDVKAGEFVTAKVDLHYTPTGTSEMEEIAIKAGLPEGLPRLADPDRLAIIVDDHHGIHALPSQVGTLKKTREYAQRYGVKKLYDVNTGIAHAFVAEEGLVRPGMLVCGKDSHSTTTGAVNALANPVSAVESTWIYLTGELWFRVPETIKIVCNGKLQDGVEPKDVFLYFIGKYKPSMAQYKSIEWKGPIVDAMGMDDRFTMAAHSVELGAKCAPFEPDSTCLKYVTSTPHGGEEFWPTPADADAVYEKVYEEDFTDLEPQVAIPHGFDVVKPVSEVEGTKVDMVNLGSCANGRYDDLARFANIIKGKKLKVRTTFSPATWRVYKKAIDTGILGTMVDAGVVIIWPSCLPCTGIGACLADNEVAFGATTRNFRGRYGNANAKIYLGSPSTAAATAIMGEITDPRKFL